MLNSYYKSSIDNYCKKDSVEIFGIISSNNNFDLGREQQRAWLIQIDLLKRSLNGLCGEIFFEFSIPRMGKRVDNILIIENVVFVIEFKVGESNFQKHQIDQVLDYALDLKNFHEPSHNAIIVPVLISTEAKRSQLEIFQTNHNDNLLNPILCNQLDLRKAILLIIEWCKDSVKVNLDEYASGRYSPTPTIIEAAVSLYSSHSVDAITRSDASAINLRETTKAISDIIEDSKANNKKSICFVTGVPGAGKTLVGLNVATSHLDKKLGNSSVYLSGNGPLVSILQEALTRDKVKREKSKNNKLTKKEALQGVKSFIQIIHHYRDTYLFDKSAPYDHVAIFDEAQRAWDREQTSKFMKIKKGQLDFDFSEPEFLISCLDRHIDWAVVVCLVGGGQEINTGEAGISEWINAISNRFINWGVYISPNLNSSEYSAQKAIEKVEKTSKIYFDQNLHLGVSMRSFRAEKLSQFIKELLDREIENAINTLREISKQYPIVISRDLIKAKNWLKEKARGSERYGIVVSSQAYRLKPLAIDVKSTMNPVNWFLEGKDDVRSSFYLEDVATEFQIQGLELDWTCVVWDADLRFNYLGWKYHSFVGSKWQKINKEHRQRYLINAYRVLLTRARQGMVIVVPEGNDKDHTRLPEFYNETFDYLKELGITEIS
jgi:DUF2075 family protein